MKRLIYISRQARNLSATEIQQLGELSSRNNQQYKITGVLLYLNGIFFQILEGPVEKVDNLYTKIRTDDRHTELLCLKTEYHLNERLFPDWAMQVINLGEYDDIFLQPLKVLLQTLTQSHWILERYTQPSVINIINNGLNPLHVLPQTVEKFVLFSDIFAFSTFAEKCPINEVVTLVNHYFALCTRIITDHGGEVIKLIGDSVMASFAQEQGDAALTASLEILSELKKLRDRVASNNILHLLYTGIGISYGTVIEGNIGSTIKTDYTLLGDIVNVAARLEALTRQLPYALALTTAVKNHTHFTWPFVKIGQHQVKGKQELIEVYSIADQFTKKTHDAQQLARVISRTLDERMS